ncbi:hypothetical protein NDU88_001169 [Pleurodeles waltl]|uniref:Uncharacterized protein n=1 Tax=Pleurodeles waltl TaxID=8319 RepID=A0AAV7LKL9_PLEWA|nr:hypothetical protein NDU88_001169 [Pleurodeles waltl]
MRTHGGKRPRLLRSEALCSEVSTVRAPPLPPMHTASFGQTPSALGRGREMIKTLLALALLVGRVGAGRWVVGDCAPHSAPIGAGVPQDVPA